MAKLKVPPPFSCGLFLTYKCTGECRHCMYACSPKWGSDWISLDDAKVVLKQLSEKFHEVYPPGFRSIGINHGLHFTGGEPFLNFDLLVKLTKIAKELEIPATFVETNCFWCTDRGACLRKLTELQEAGLDGILVSVNPFILEHVPLERATLAIEVSREVFGENVLVYQEGFCAQMKKIGVRKTMPFERTVEVVGPDVLENLELLLKGRAAYRLGHLYRKYPASRFFRENCLEELTRPWHVHVDNYLNYMPGYCGGISLGDASDLDSICSGIELEERPILKALVSGLGELYEFAEEFGYEELPQGYVSKCHLCVDIRRHIATESPGEFAELKPQEFYRYLTASS
jgi:hypothetical protein